VAVHFPHRLVSFFPPPLHRLQVPAQLTVAPRIADEDRQAIDLLKVLVRAYFNIVRKNVGDAVPKAVMYFLVNAGKDNTQNELVRCLYKVYTASEVAVCMCWATSRPG